jgi:hypothetical protein
MALPEQDFGPFAVSRGDGAARFITLRNLTWNPVHYKVRLDETVGLSSGKDFEVRRFHPSEKILGRFARGSTVDIEVAPFRSCLIGASAGPFREIGVMGCDYEIVRDTPGKPVIIKLLGLPGTRASVTLSSKGGRTFSRATLDHDGVEDFLDGGALTVTFPGTPLKHPWHRKIGSLVSCDVPPDAEALFEATCFAADSNALEVRSILRSGPSRIEQVQKARKVFFEKPMFVNRGIWDRNVFDDDLGTFFMARYEGGLLRVDFGETVLMDTLVIRIKSKHERYINAALHSFAEDNRAEVSSDLRTWIPVAHWSGKGSYAVAKIPSGMRVRYVRVFGAPARIAEIEGYLDGEMLDRSKWRASNLLGPYEKRPAVDAWSLPFTLDEIPAGSYLAIALPGRHGKEGAWAALRVEGEPVGAPDRSLSFPSNTWEYKNSESDSNYTYYVPLTGAMAGKKMEAVVLVLEGGVNEIKPELYITAYPTPHVSRELVLYEAKQ